MAEAPEDWPALIWQQQRELAQLRHSQEELLQRLCTQLEGLQSTVTGHVERALESRHEQERILVGSGTAWGGSSILGPGRDMGPAAALFLSYNAERRLERALAEGQQRGGQLQEQLTQQLSQALSSAVAGRLERSIRDEIKKTVPPCEFCMETSGWARWEWGPLPVKLLLMALPFPPHPVPGVSRSLEPVAGQLSNSVATKLTAVEGSMKENISKLLKSKVLWDPR